MSDKCKSMDLAVRDPKTLQSTAERPLEGYTHPIRCTSLNAPPKLKEHASHAHPGSSAGDSGENKSMTCLVNKKTTAHDSSRPAISGKDPAQPAIGYSTGLDPSNSDIRLRHAKDPCRGFLPTTSDLSRPSTPSDDSDVRLDVSGPKAKPRYLERQVSTHGGSPPDDDEPSGHERHPKMLRQPETWSISHDQLVIEVKGIYAGLVMVESKCIDIDENQSLAAQERDPAKRTMLMNDQWQSLIVLHKQLLHEHHDFFLASQHPAASLALSSLAAKYLMPARMWEHGIHAFLKVLRYRLPESLEHMSAFIYIAYELLALLYETVPTFKATWIECLGDLGRFRMAIDEEVRIGAVWKNVARFWYDQAADRNPTTGRIYHHLAILARPSIKQLSLYMRALTCPNPFRRAQESIMALFNPILYSQDQESRRPSSFETVFIRAHGILFTIQSSDPLDRSKALAEIGDLYEKYISKYSSRMKKTGMHVAVSNIAALLEYGTSKKISFPEIQPPSAEPSQPQADTSTRSKFKISLASKLASDILGISLTRANNRNMYPLVHVYLVFIWSLVAKKFDDDLVWGIIEKNMPWAALCSFLNTLAAEPQAMTTKVWAEDFPKPDNGRPLPEDFAMRGQLYSKWYFPHTWFTDARIDANERSLELPSMIEPRAQRILWLGLRIASTARWIRYDVGAQCFVLQPQATDQDNVILDDATSESNVDITQYTPSGSSTTSDFEAPCFTPEATSNAPSEPHDNSPAQSTGGSERAQKQARTADFVSHYNLMCLRRQLLEVEPVDDQSILK